MCMSSLSTSATSMLCLSSSISPRLPLPQTIWTRLCRENVNGLGKTEGKQFPLPGAANIWQEQKEGCRAPSCCASCKFSRTADSPQSHTSTPSNYGQDDRQIEQIIGEIASQEKTEPKWQIKKERHEVPKW